MPHTDTVHSITSLQVGCSARRCVYEVHGTTSCLIDGFDLFVSLCLMDRSERGQIGRHRGTLACTVRWALLACSCTTSQTRGMPLTRGCVCVTANHHCLSSAYTIGHWRKRRLVWKPAERRQSIHKHNNVQTLHSIYHALRNASKLGSKISRLEDQTRHLLIM